MTSWVREWSPPRVLRSNLACQKGDAETVEMLLNAVRVQCAVRRRRVAFEPECRVRVHRFVTADSQPDGCTAA